MNATNVGALTEIKVPHACIDGVFNSPNAGGIITKPAKVRIIAKKPANDAADAPLRALCAAHASLRKCVDDAAKGKGVAGTEVLALTFQAGKITQVKREGDASFPPALAACFDKALKATSLGTQSGSLVTQLEIDSKN
jgi:hypothetical protein